jgi:LacI family transcriptional regulator
MHPLLDDVKGERLVLTTIRQVAEQAQVSIATVSAVITGNRPVSAKLRARVEDAMNKLDYRPNALARALYSNRTQTIAFMVPSIANPGFSNALHAVETIANQRGYSVFVCNTNGSPAVATQYQKRLLEMRIDGVLIALTWELADAQFIDAFHKHNVQVVGLSGGRVMPGIPCYLGDEEQGGYDLGCYLTSLGHRCCAFVGPKESAVGKLRLKGLRAAFELVDGSVPDTLLAYTDTYDASAGRRAVYDLLLKKERFSCVVGFNDVFATGILSALTDQGFSVPERISVATFGDVYAPFTHPAMTTMVYQEAQAGTLAATCLLDRITGKSVENEVHRIPLTLEVRASTRAVRT